MNTLNGGGRFNVPVLVPVTILPSNAPLVYTVQSNGSTLVSDVATDTYSIQLTAAPVGGQPNADGVIVGGQPISVVIVTDGKTFPTAADPNDTRWTTTQLPQAIIVTFTAGNWYIPFVVQLDEESGAARDGPVPAGEGFPAAVPAGRARRHVDGRAVAAGPDEHRCACCSATTARSTRLPCTDVLEQEDNAPGQHRDFSDATGFGCNTVPGAAADHPAERARRLRPAAGERRSAGDLRGGERP